MKRHRCKGPHDWRERKRSPGTFECAGCGSVFPCRHACEHIDCLDKRGDERALARVLGALAGECNATPAAAVELRSDQAVNTANHGSSDT
jgi:hypothetical protein